MKIGCSKSKETLFTSDKMKGEQNDDYEAFNLEEYQAACSEFVCFSWLSIFHSS